MWGQANLVIVGCGKGGDSEDSLDSLHSLGREFTYDMYLNTA